MDDPTAAPRLAGDMTRLLDHYRAGKRLPASMMDRHWHPAIDVFEQPDGFHIIAALAGMAEDAVDVVVDGQQIVIRGTRPQFGQGQSRIYHQMEIAAGPFERVIQLPAAADLDGAQASYANGYLEIVVPFRARQERSVPIGTREDQP